MTDQTPAPDDAASAVPSSSTEQVPAAASASGEAGQAPALETPVSDAGAQPSNEHSPSLLEEFVADQNKDGNPDGGNPAEKPEEKKDAPSDGEAKPEGEMPAEEAPKPELPKVEYKYDLPETIQMDDGQKEEFHTALDEFRADPEKGAQHLIAMHEKTMQAYAEHLGNEQWRVFNEMRAEQRKEVMADPILGGAGFNTAMGVIARMRDKFASSSAPGTAEYEADLKAFDVMLRTTGVGDNIHFLRLLHNVGRKFDEPPLPPPGARPVPESGRRPGESRGSRMYPSMQSDSQS